MDLEKFCEGAQGGLEIFYIIRESSGKYYYDVYSSFDDLADTVSSSTVDIVDWDWDMEKGNYSYSDQVEFELWFEESKKDNEQYVVLASDKDEALELLENMWQGQNIKFVYRIRNPL